MNSKPIHLCQPDNEKSCGACCGLYNWNDFSKASVEPLLRKRTELFRSLEGDPESLSRYKRIITDLSSPLKLFETIHNCEYLGFVDNNCKRVGCLLHPLVNNNTDLRDVSFYGKELCASHECPSYIHLTEQEKRAVIYGASDWYIYGLAITDIDFIKEYFKIINNTIGETVVPEAIKEPELGRVFSDYLRLKVDWEFKSKESRFGKYCFSYAEYHIDKIDYQKKLGINGSPFDKILVSLSSEFDSVADLTMAEEILQKNIDRFVRVYTSHYPNFRFHV